MLHTLKLMTPGESSSVTAISCVTNFHTVGYTAAADGVSSAEKSDVAISSGRRTGSRSSISCQCSSRMSKVLASLSLTTLRSLMTAVTGQRSSKEDDGKTTRTLVPGFLNSTQSLPSPLWRMAEGQWLSFRPGIWWQALQTDDVDHMPVFG